ncbi:MAG: ATP synthase subunit I [Gammaproteobacteria bacterium]
MLEGMATGCRESGESSGFFVARKGRKVVQTDSRAARQLVVTIFLGQLGVSLLVAGLFQFLGGLSQALSALIGGGIGAFASLIMALFVFRGGAEKSPGAFLRGVYVGEFFKLILTVGLFIVVIVNVDVAILPLLIGYAATFVVYWAALLKAMPKVSKPGG